MTKARPLTKLLLASLKITIGFSTVNPDQVEALLREVIAEARRTWPTVDIPPTWFIPYLSERISPSTDIIDAIRNVESSDLYLACAVAHLDPQGLEAFDHSYGKNIDQCLARCENLGDGNVQTRDEIFHSLFRVDSVRPGEIAQFNGCEPLISWLRVLTTQIKRRDSRPPPKKNHGTSQLSTSHAAPEAIMLPTCLKESYLHAFSQAMRSLLPRERNLLRQRIVDGMSLDEISAFHSVHRVTASRWLVKVRERLSQRTTQLMLRNLDATSDVHPMVQRIIHSHLDFSISRYLTQPSKRTSPDGASDHCV